MWDIFSRAREMKIIPVSWPSCHASIETQHDFYLAQAEMKIIPVSSSTSPAEAGFLPFVVTGLKVSWPGCAQAAAEIKIIPVSGAGRPREMKIMTRPRPGGPCERKS